MRRQREPLTNRKKKTTFRFIGSPDRSPWFPLDDSVGFERFAEKFQQKE
jgi:hypothetical protein